MSIRAYTMRLYTTDFGWWEAKITWESEIHVEKDPTMGISKLKGPKIVYHIFTVCRQTKEDVFEECRKVVCKKEAG